MSTTTALPAAMAALTEAARAAGVDPAVAEAEGRGLAAAVIEGSGSTVHQGWAQAWGVPESDFFEWAPKGRRYASSPTNLLATLVAEASPSAAGYAQALADVAVAACTVPGAPATAVGRATLVSQAQLRAAGALPAPHGPGTATAGLNPPGALPPDTTPAGLRSRSSLDLGMPRGGSGANLPDGIPEATLSGSRVLEQIQALQRATRETLGGSMIPGWGRSEQQTGPDDPAPTAPSDTGAGPATSAPSTPQQGASGDAAAAQQTATPAEPVAPSEPEKSVEELLAELDALVGLTRVKREVHRQVALLQMEAKREKAGLKAATITRHLVFTGNPGTGKTTVARLVGGIYRAIGLLSKGQLVEVDRSELVAGYLGQTASKTAEVCASAAGGVLFIDEAYSLTGDQYGKEAIDTLVKEMEDRREDLVVIVAGYPEPMREFIAANPGLSSRFRTIIAFDDYTDAELTEILRSAAGKVDYDLSEDAITRFHEMLAATPRDDSFGNGRYARNVLEAAIGRQAWRLRDVDEPTVEQLRTIERVDLEDREDVALSTEGQS